MWIWTILSSQGGRGQKDIEMLKPAFSLEVGIVLLSMVLPSSGYILLKKQARGILMIAWMLVMGFITYQLTDESISFVGRYSGGFAVWILSVVEIHSMVFRRKR